MRTLLTVILAVSLTACGTIKSWVPSGWDDNQSARIIDVQLAVQELDCAEPHLPQVNRIKSNLDWFELYSRAKGWRQQDVLALIAPMKATVDDFHKRSLEGQGTQGYCVIKRKIMDQQARRAAEAVLGRF